SSRTRGPPPVAILTVNGNECGFRKEGCIRERASGVFLACRAATRVDIQRRSAHRDLQTATSATGGCGNRFCTISFEAHFEVPLLNLIQPLRTRAFSFSRSSPRRTLPLAVFGSSSINSISRGNL